MIFLLSDFANGKTALEATWFCQINSDFWCHEKACFLRKKIFVGKYAENERFRKLLIANNFRFLYKQWDCQSYAMTRSKLWNEVVTAMLWWCHMPQVSGSKHSYERLRCHMWQFRVWEMRKLEQKSRFFTCFSFLDWTEKSTEFCNNKYQILITHPIKLSKRPRETERP